MCIVSGNGYITTDVLREILRELDNNITKEELDMMIQEIDSDGSGTVDFDGCEIIMLDFFRTDCFSFRIHGSNDRRWWLGQGMDIHYCQRYFTFKLCN